MHHRIVINSNGIIVNQCGSKKIWSSYLKSFDRTFIQPSKMLLNINDYLDIMQWSAGG